MQFGLRQYLQVIRYCFEFLHDESVLGFVLYSQKACRLGIRDSKLCSGTKLSLSDRDFLNLFWSDYSS